MSTPFDADSGSSQGRIRPENWTPVIGDYVVCLGCDDLGQRADLIAGDFIELTQDYDATGANLLQFVMHLRPPTNMPDGVTWTVVISTAVSDYFEFMPVVGSREVTIIDMTVPTVVNQATSTIRVKLALLGPAGIHDVEFPGVYVDAFLPAEPGQNPLVACRSPRRDDTGVFADEPIKFNVFGISDALTDVTIRIDGAIVAVFTGAGATTASFTDPGWSAFAVDADGYTTRYTLQSLTPFESESVVTVFVESSTAINTTYTEWAFTIADTEGPRLVSAEATGLFDVMCTFNEQIPDSAIDESLYTLALVSDPPGFVPTVVDVRREDAERLVLVIDQPATPGATYSVTAAGVLDMFGNVIEAPYDTAEFVTFSSSLTPATRVLSLYRELPEADRDTDEHGELKLLCDILDEGLRALTVVVDEWPLIVADPDTATEEFLDAILWEMGNPFFWIDLSVAKKRLLARNLLALYALKGSGPGIIAAIRLLLGIEVTIHVYGFGMAPLGGAIMGETFVLGSDDEDDLYTFWVVIPEQLDAETRLLVNRIVNVMKVAHERHILVEPEDLFIPDHWALGFSALGVETELHAS